MLNTQTTKIRVIELGGHLGNVRDVNPQNVPLSSTNKTGGQMGTCPPMSPNVPHIGGETMQATGQLNEMAHAMQRKWGVDRLPGLVPPAWRAKFDTLKAALDAATSNGGNTDAAASALLKAWVAMDAQATAAGHEPMEDTWEAEWAPGRIFSIVRDDEHRQTVILRNQAEGRTNVSVFSVADMGRLVHSIPDVARIVELFPGAYVATPPAETRKGKRRVDDIDDAEIPFGGDEVAA